MLEFHKVRSSAIETVVTGGTLSNVVETGRRLDAATLRAAFPMISEREADDLLGLVVGACHGPKIGFPATPSLVTVNAQQQYK